MKIELDPFEELQELTQRLNYYRDAYYNKNLSIISDEEYDKLYDKLIELENQVGYKLDLLYQVQTNNKLEFLP